MRLGIALLAMSVASADAPFDGGGLQPAVAVCISRLPPRAPRTEPRWAHALFPSMLASLSDDARSRLDDTLAASNARWERRVNPLLDDLEDGEPDDALDHLVATLSEGPALRVGVAALRAETCASDGLCVRPSRVDLPCPAGWSSPASGRVSERARFLAWPWGSAVVLRAATPGEARASAEALRRLGKSLVVQANDAEGAASGRFEATRAHWQRHEVLTRVAGVGLAAATNGDDAPPPLPVRLDPDVILLFPIGGPPSPT